MDAGGAIQIWTSLPTEPPSHPAPPVSLPVADCFPWWYVFTPDVRLKPTTYLAATSSPSPWPGVMVNNDIEDGGHKARTHIGLLAGLYETGSARCLAHTGPIKIGGGA